MKVLEEKQQDIVKFVIRSKKYVSMSESNDKVN